MFSETEIELAVDKLSPAINISSGLRKILILHINALDVLVLRCPVSFYGHGL